MPPSAWNGRIAVPQRAPGLDVEPGGRLVEEDQPGPADERQRHREPPLLPAGQPAGLPPRPGRSRPNRSSSSARRQRVGEVRRDEVDAPRRPAASAGRPVSCGVTPMPPPAGRVARVAAEQLDPARSRPAQADEQVDQGGLAGAVRAEQADELAGADVEGDPVEGERRRRTGG